MKTVSMEAGTRARAEFHERRCGRERRQNPGRRSMIRFDANGGDRRSGEARRSTDLGFRKEDDVLGYSY